MSEQQVFSDRYQLVNHIARGGMAQVYLARDLLLDRPVALKVLFPELSVDRAFVERFRREAKAAANLTHPNIVSIYDWGQGENTYFIVMEYVDGRTLSSILREGPLDPARAAEIGADVAAALDFAHRRGVIHRDVKPGNVLINNSGQVKVADFGIARAIGTSEDLTQTGSVMGTATYFSPEQAQGYGVDPRSDVYSLGVVLYEMATGRAPFTGDSPVSIAYKHVKEAVPVPRSVNPAVPAAFEAIVLKCLEKQPEQRYQTAEDLRADLIRFANGQPVIAATDATRVGTAVGAGVAGAALAGAALAGDATRVQGAAGGTTAMPVTTVGGPLGPAGAAGAAWGAGGPPGGPAGGGEDRSRQWAYGAMAVAILLLLAVGIFFLGRSAGWWGSTAKTLTIPTDVVGKPVANAMGELQQLGFTKVSQQNQASSQYAEGDVISTNPSPGTSVKANSPVVLLVSSGPTPVQVPNVAGKTQDAATAILQQAGFTVNVTQQNSSTVAQGLAIGTDPPAGNTAGKGSAVQLIISSGKQQVQIPSLVNQSPGAAGQALGQLGLNVQQQSEASSSVQAGLVTRTSPPAGATVPVGSTVTVFVSSGPSQVTVPNVVGETQSQAQSDLTNAGFQVNVVQVNVNKVDKNGIVQQQSPQGGQSANQGSTVTIFVGQFQGLGSTTTSTTPPP
ncbi:MAG TPA: Stk1 family PASTA domain-containing Ser/Thr kinase [Acidimicrobiales bacterium]|nr:Stk1 family PASTA domain-containing Ser/Thr kinase [Acidimicrobiales bacterium]